MGIVWGVKVSKEGVIFQWEGVIFVKERSHLLTPELFLASQSILTPQ